MPQTTFGRQPPMMPKTPRMGVQGGLRKYPAQVVPFGGAPMSNEAARVAPPGVTPATVHGAYGDTSVPNMGYQYQPAAPAVGHFNVPIGGVSGGAMHPPMVGHGQPVPHPPMPMVPWQYAPPSVPPTQMAPHPAEQHPVYSLPGGSASSGGFVSPPMAPAPMPMRPRVPGEYVSPPGINLAPHPLVDNSPQFNQAIDLLRGQQNARQDLLDRNVRSYDSMGRPPGYVPAGASGIPGMVAAHQNQQMLNGLSVSDANRLRLGGAVAPAPLASTAPPTLDSTSRFATPRGVNHNEATGSTYFRNGKGSGIVGSNAIAALEAQGIRPTDLAGVNFNPDVRNALRKVTQDSESRLASERSAAGGGVSKAAQYARAQSDQKILNRAVLSGRQTPASAQAAIRETARREDLRDRMGTPANVSGIGVPKPSAGLNDRRAAAAAFAQTPIGTDLQKIGNYGDKLHEYVKKNWGGMSPPDRAAVQNYIQYSPHIKPGDDLAHNAGLDSLNALFGSNTKPSRVLARSSNSSIPPAPEKKPKYLVDYAREGEQQAARHYERTKGYGR